MLSPVPPGAAANKPLGLPQLCSITTQHPVLYYKRTPPTYSFGYEVRGLACGLKDGAPARAVPTEAAGPVSALGFNYSPSRWVCRATGPSALV